MNEGEFDGRKRIVSLKEAMDFYGERNGVDGNSSLKIPQMDFAEPSPRKKELHLAKRDIDRFKDSRKVADSVKTRAESELINAKKTVRDLSLRIEESNLRAKMQTRGVEKLKNPKRRNEEWGLARRNNENNEYLEVMRELEYIKQELSKLKIDMASVLEEKRLAEKETEASSSKLRSYSNSMEVLKKEIDELNEEHVLVELARIEALKESDAIEAQRNKEAKEYSFTIEETKKKVDGIIEEINEAKEIEMKLAVTMEDVNVLQNELALVKEIEKKVKRNESLKHSGPFSESPSLLGSVSEELEAAKKELAATKEEGYQFMASMDVIRNELRHVSAEIARLKKKEDKAELTIQNLNSKLLRAKAKFESVSAAEEKANSMVSNLNLTLEHMETEVEAAKKERELISDETAKIKEEIPKIESDIDMAEEKLHAALQELEAVKSSEAIALENLKNLTENTMRDRALVSQHSSTITISTFEYEYLQGRAVGAEEIADKKVAAAQAWVEALKASEKEILMKTEIAHREIREVSVEDDRSELPLPSKNWDSENLQLEVPPPRKTVNRNGIMTPLKRAKFRKSNSPGGRHLSRTSSVTAKRKKEVMPNLAKLFSGKNIERGS